MNPATRALLRAAADGDIALVRSLLAQGTDVNATNTSGQTALMLAAAFGRANVISVLLKAGADNDQQDELGLTAVNWATNYPEVCELLKPSVQELVQQQWLQPELTPSPAQEQNQAQQTKRQPEPIRTPEPEPHPERQIVEQMFNEPSTERASRGPEAWPTPVPFDAGQTVDKGEEERSTVTPGPPTATPGEPRLKGLAAAILRDHKPEIANKQTQPVPFAPIVDDPVRTNKRDETVDETLGRTEETSHRTIRPRIFDMDPSAGEPRRQSKVEVTVPTFGSHDSRNRALRWAVVILVLAAAAYGSYRLVSYLVSKPTTAASQPAPTSPLPVNTNTNPVGGDIAGTSGTNTQPPTISPTPAPQPSASPFQAVTSATTAGPLAGTERVLVQPKLPANLKSQRVAGTVTILLRVNRSGRVISWRTLDGDERLRSIALQAAKQSTFAPDKLPGKSEVVGTVIYTFK